MYVDEEKIINDTLNVFFTSEIQKQKYNSIQDFVSEDNYRKLHKSPLIPLDIKIDIELFEKELFKFEEFFEQWGNQHLHLPRKGLALVNQDGILKSNDPVNGSLYEWNVNHPNNPLLETDCIVPTKVLDIDSLRPLRALDSHWCRSNILIWEKGAEFLPHIDTIVPSPWIRLWGTTSNSIKLRFSNKNKLEDYGDVEPGRIYIIDTSLVHDARCTDKKAAQFFLSVLPSAYDILTNLSLN